MSDYLTDEEQAERLKRWWVQNGTSLIVGVVLAVAAVLGWRWYQGYEQDQADAASDVYASYVAARNEAEPTADQLATIDTEFEGSGYHVFTLLYRADDEIEVEDWEEALALLERAVQLADNDILKDIARYRAAKVLYQLDRLDECEAELAAIRSTGLEAHVAALSGDVFVARGDLERARTAYRSGIDAARRDPNNPVPGVELMELKLASLVDESQ
ncbi:MAG: tetratricopeptide repeat protein [Gammaproteobacteria bacterium]|nr:tetratricopeptide repeat protein [Gammaproteobacteria bacterium]MDE0440753.1 tetratricopeptide repeat protein [Gammaproteobacteria bacterium]